MPKECVKRGKGRPPLPEDQKRKRVSVTVAPGLAEWLTNWAAQEGCTKSDLVEEALGLLRAAHAT